MAVPETGDQPRLPGGAAGVNWCYLSVPGPHRAIRRRPSTIGVWDNADPMNEFAARARDTESTACRQVVDSSRVPEESSFRSLAETSLQGIIVHRDWRILFANRAAAQTLGYPTVGDLVSVESFLQL